jgi:hypothetical protein
MAVIEFDGTLYPDEGEADFAVLGVLTTEALSKLPQRLAEVWSTPEARFEVEQLRKVRACQHGIAFRATGRYVEKNA